MLRRVMLCAGVLLALLTGWVRPADAVPFNNDCTFAWDANKESDLAGYRAWASKGSTQKPVVNVPVSPNPSVKCSQLGVDTDGQWTFSVVAYDNAQTANVSTAASISEIRDTVPPDTTLTANINGANASFVLTSNESGGSFECQLDGGAWVQCTSPRTYTGLADGQHTFRARAKDIARNVDPTPPSHTWSINVQPPAQPSGLSVQPGDLTATPNP